MARMTDDERAARIAVENGILQLMAKHGYSYSDIERFCGQMCQRAQSRIEQANA